MTSLPLIIAISGPPRSGKDTSASILSEILEETSPLDFTDKSGRTWRHVGGYKVGLHRMSAPLKSLAAEMLPEKKWATEELKDREMNGAGTSFRDVQIGLYFLGSNLFGSDWLGHHYVRKVHSLRYLDYILMPDAGRPEDLQPLLDLEIPVRQYKIERLGTTYEGDSRVDFIIKNFSSWLIPNNGSLEDLRSQILESIKAGFLAKPG